MDIDTREGRATGFYLTPKRIDFGEVEEASHDAGYTLTRLTLVVSGERKTGNCTTCAGEVDYLEVERSGQVLELVGEVPAGRVVRVKGNVTGWGSDHSRLTVLEVDGPADDPTP